MSKFNNPIMRGFYPDPSVCRVDNKFYLVNSTFTYFPGVPIFESENLVNWIQIGNILDRKSQNNLSELDFSLGIYAPTIRYNNGVFYLITTNIGHGGNFIVKSEKPEGPWSEPYFIEGAAGIDPSLFFDDDGKAYYVGTRGNSNGEKYYGDGEIWAQEINLDKMCLIGESHILWYGAMRNAEWPEGPHLYKKDGYYYLMIAEGGTGDNHSITIARSKNIFGEYQGNPKNPIITHRHLGKNYPIKNVGHGDLVNTKNGEWFIVLLASRPYEGYTNLGRETFLAKVQWEDGWPVVNPGEGKVLFEQEIDMDTIPIKENRNYNFSIQKLGYEWLFLRNSNDNLYSLSQRQGYLRLYLRDNKITELGNVSYIGLRQNSLNYEVSSYLEFSPKNAKECAGIAVVQNNKYNIRYEIAMRNNDYLIRVIKCINGEDTSIAEQKIKRGNVQLRIVNKKQKSSFYYRCEGYKEEFLIDDISTIELSTEVAQGFVGSTIGMYASSNGEETYNYVDYKYFNYINLD